MEEKLNFDVIKFNIVEPDIDFDDCSLKIIVNRNFLSTVFFSLLLFQSSLANSTLNLTPREQEILKYIAKGYNNNEVASKLFISSHTVKIHLRNIFEKLEVKDRTEAVVKAIKYGIISIYDEE